jgi:hypothetical protein
MGPMLTTVLTERGETDRISTVCRDVAGRHGDADQDR